jgi:hypothetical protein
MHLREIKMQKNRNSFTIPKLILDL